MRKENRKIIRKKKSEKIIAYKQACRFDSIKMEKSTNARFGFPEEILIWMKSKYKCTEKSSLTSKLDALIFSAFILAFVWV